MAAQVPNIFVEQYDQGQKKIRADLMDENFAYVCTQLDANADTAAGKTTVAEAAHAAMPSARTVSVSLPSSNSTATAPADGYFVLRGARAHGQTFARLSLGIAGGIFVSSYEGTGNVFFLSLPCSAGDEVIVYYLNNDSDYLSLYFVYANGQQQS